MQVANFVQTARCSKAQQALQLVAALFMLGNKCLQKAGALLTLRRVNQDNQTRTLPSKERVGFEKPGAQAPLCFSRATFGKAKYKSGLQDLSPANRFFYTP